MVTQTNRLERASAPKLGREFGTRLKNSHFIPDAPVRASQRGAASGAPNTPDETNSSQSSVTEVDFAELKDGTLVELVEDSKNPGRTCFAVWKDGETRFVDRLEQDGQVFVPLSRKNEVLAHLRLTSAVLPYESVPALLRCLESLIMQCVAVDEKHARVLADFV